MQADLEGCNGPRDQDVDRDGCQSVRQRGAEPVRLVVLRQCGLGFGGAAPLALR